MSEPTAIGELLGAALDAIETSADRSVGPTSITCGISSIDRLASIRTGRQIVVAGIPGTGKSAFAIGAARASAEKGVASLIFSTGMKRSTVVERLLSQQSGIPCSRMQAGRINGEDWVALGRASKALEALPIWIDDSILSVSTVQSRAERWRSEVAPEFREAIVVVDYVNMLKGEDQNVTRAVEVGRISRILKHVARETESCTIVVANLNRQWMVEHREPDIGDLRDSGELAQDADMIAFIQPEEINAAGAVNEIRKLFIAKNSHSIARFAVDMRWDAKTFRFHDPVDANDSSAWEP